ncbi:MAG TPA: ABC transporter permease [Streptosporangiaceae bacterium]|jgi:ABC-2 type transport system permease protein
MTATVAAPAVPARHVPISRGYRFELVKLVSQWRLRVLILAAWILPAVLVSEVSQQSSLPADTLFGRWMHATGWAGSLVVLGFAGTYALPLLTSVVAGDVFAMEDRLGTWRHLLVAMRSPSRIFAAKALASLTIIVLLLAGLACSSVVGVLVVGNHPLVGLDGHVLASADAAGKVLLAWLCALGPTLALAAIGLLGSVTLGRSPMGLLLPALAGLAMDGAQILPLPVAVRAALPSYGFIAWRGLFTSPVQLGPVLVATAVSLVWTAIVTVLAYWLFLRRDFTSGADPGLVRRVFTVGVLPLAALLAVTAGILAVAVPVTRGSGIEQGKLQSSVATAYAHLYVVQTQQLHRPRVTEAQLHVGAYCDKNGGLAEASGPGNGWRCTVTWHVPGVVDAEGQAIYQLDVTPDGRYIADGDGPVQVNGYFLVRTPTGDAANPLWQFDGTVDLLATKG